MNINQWMQRSKVAFGTSGARGLVVDMTDQVCFAYVLGFLQHLETLGEFSTGGAVALAGDLRPSTPRILRACIAAIRFAGGVPVFCGYVPTPALCFYAYARKIPSLMVTGSHIPADRNGIKFNRAEGEFLKTDEAAMRQQEIALPVGWFDEKGALLAHEALPEPIDVRGPFIKRYQDFFGAQALEGMRLGVYQHSAVGRDLLVDLVTVLGGEAVALGRSDEFVSVDTEAVREEDIELAAQWALNNRFDAILTTDGDSDRPLFADETGKWLRGDVLGILAAEHLGAEYVVTPVSSNTALEKAAPERVTKRTKIGSPYVIEAMMDAAGQGYAPAVGYEANGGFLLASSVRRGDRELASLPTRDSVLPMLCALALAQKVGKPVSQLSGSLPSRYTASNRLPEIPTEISKERITALREDLRAGLKALGFSGLCDQVRSVNETDGLRITFSNDDILHFRPSGNAPELRIYTESSTEEGASSLLREALGYTSSWKM